MSEDLDLALKATTAVPSSTFKREVGLRAARQMLGDDDESLQTIEDELRAPSAQTLVGNGNQGS